MRNDQDHMIIAIDGPSASGKSTLGRMLARALNLLYLDTGSMYRAVALAAIDSQVDPSDAEAVTELANRIDIDLEGDPDSLKVFLAGRDITQRIRNDDVTAMSSVVSVIPGVRRAMVARQRAMGQRGAVLNGRDIGTVVFPDADVKFFLTAVPEERAERRFKEDQMTAGSSATLGQTLAEMVERDKRDSTRTDSPLKIADDAIVIDSTGKNIEQVFAEMMERIG
ncbi:MAG TPA: (d)CMP kinase [Pyrinomonadaceae bacterium]|nr:(d)CMP kinase [Pyrinomonadaceae bacterium]